MEHRAMMRRSLSLQRLSAGCDDNHRFHNSNSNSSCNNKMSDVRGKGSLSLSFSSGWFGKNKPINESSTKNEEYTLPFGYNPKQTSSTSTSCSCPEQQKLRVQEIAQNRSIEQDFLSRMRESGVVTSAGYQAVLHDFVASQRKEEQAATDNKTAACIPSIKMDRRAEMGSSQKSSSQRSSLRSSSRQGSSRRFPSFFTACSFHDDEDFAPSRNPSDSADSMRDGGAEVMNRRRRSCRRRGSSRRFGSFFTGAGDDFSEIDNTEANIAPLRRSVQLTQEQMEQLENADDELNINLDRCESQSSLSNANSSLSDSLQIIDRGEKTNMRRGSSTSLDLDEIFFDAIEKCIILRSESNSSTPNESLQNRSQDSSDDSVETRSACDSPTHSKKCKGEENFSNEQEHEESCSFGSSESSCGCGWLPWPARRGSIEDKRNESYATLQALQDDNSFLPWPEHRTPKNNGRALAA